MESIEFIRLRLSPLEGTAASTQSNQGDKASIAGREAGWDSGRLEPTVAGCMEMLARLLCLDGDELLAQDAAVNRPKKTGWRVAPLPNSRVPAAGLFHAATPRPLLSARFYRRHSRTHPSQSWDVELVAEAAFPFPLTDLVARLAAWFPKLEVVQPLRRVATALPAPRGSTTGPSALPVSALPVSALPVSLPPVSSPPVSSPPVSSPPVSSPPVSSPPVSSPRPSSPLGTTFAAQARHEAKQASGLRPQDTQAGSVQAKPTRLPKRRGAPLLACNQWLDEEMARLPDPQHFQSLYYPWLMRYQALRGYSPQDPGRSFRAAVVGAQRRLGLG